MGTAVQKRTSSFSDAPKIWGTNKEYLRLFNHKKLHLIT